MGAEGCSAAGGEASGFGMGFGMGVGLWLDIRLSEEPIGETGAGDESRGWMDRAGGLFAGLFI
jgi:hypothetical protein